MADGPPDRDEAARRRMVSQQIRARGVRDEAVLAALAKVPRHEFVPGEVRGSAYDDHPLPIGLGQTISQPYIVALMSEALAPRPSHRLLELGTGSGYQAAVLSLLVASVFTIEYHAALAEEAAARLSRLGYANVEVRAGDGWGGWPARAPFEAAIVTFAAPDVPAALVAQVRTGGRICIPIGQPQQVQQLMLYTKRADGALSSRMLGAVRFVPVQGERDGGAGGG